MSQCHDFTCGNARRSATWTADQCRKCWAAVNNADVARSLNRPAPGPLPTKQSAPKPCGGCGKGTAPMRVERQAKAPEPARPWVASQAPRPNILADHFNASLVEWKGRLLLCSRKGRANSRLCITPMKPDLTPASAPVELKIDHPRCRQGQEDPRFFIHQGKLWLSFLGVEFVGGQVFSWIMLAEVRDDLTLANVHHVEYRERTFPLEKNWVFFSEGEELKCVYAVEPHTILRVEDGRAERVARSPAGFGWEGHKVRGGASPVRVGNEWFHWFHTQKLGDKDGPLYAAGLYTFSAVDYRVKRWVPEPLLSGAEKNDEGKRVVFPCGAVLRDGKWVISYGWNDVAVRFATFDREEVEGRLVTLG